MSKSRHDTQEGHWIVNPGQTRNMKVAGKPFILARSKGGKLMKTTDAEKAKQHAESNLKESTMDFQKLEWYGEYKKKIGELGDSCSLKAALELNGEMSKKAKAAGLEFSKAERADLLHSLADKADFFDMNKAKNQLTKESTMDFPMLQMLAEGKKKKSVDDDMDFEMDDGMGDMDADDLGGRSAGKKKDAPKGMKAKGDASVVDKAAVLKFLKDCDPACRKLVAGKLDAMVAADETVKEGLSTPSDADIKKVMDETGMGRMQAIRHLQARQHLANNREKNKYPLGKSAMDPR